MDVRNLSLCSISAVPWKKRISWVTRLLRVEQPRPRFRRCLATGRDLKGSPSLASDSDCNHYRLRCGHPSRFCMLRVSVFLRRRVFSTVGLMLLYYEIQRPACVGK